MVAKIYSVLNYKGGVGKSTISTNLATYFANQGHNVLLGDFDIQQSAQNWLSLRPTNTAPIRQWEFVDGRLPPPPDDVTHIIIDSPAAIKTSSLKTLVGMSDKVIVPLKPGAFDMMATETFLEQLVSTINEQEKETDLCVIGNMVDARTISADQLNKFLNKLGLDSPTSICQAQLYVHLAANGLGLFDSNSSIFERHTEQWKPLLEWLEQ